MLYIVILIIVIFAFAYFLYKRCLALFGGHTIHLWNSLNKADIRNWDSAQIRTTPDETVSFSEDEKRRCEVIDFIFMAVFAFFMPYRKDKTAWYIYDESTKAYVENKKPEADFGFETALDLLKIDNDLDNYVKVNHISTHGLKDLFHKTMLAIRFNNYRMSLGLSDNGQDYFETNAPLFIEFTTLMMVNYKLYPEIIKYISGSGNNIVIFLRLHNYEKTGESETYPKATFRIKSPRKDVYKEHFYSFDINDEDVIIDGITYKKADVEKTIPDCICEENHNVVKKELKTKAPIFVLRFAPVSYAMYVKSPPSKTIPEVSFTTDKIDNTNSKRPLAVLRFNQGIDFNIDTGKPIKNDKNKEKGFNIAKQENDVRILWFNNNLQGYSLPVIMDRRLRSKWANKNDETTYFSNSFTLCPMGYPININNETERNNFLQWLVNFSTDMHLKGLLYVDYKYDQFLSYENKFYVADISCFEIDKINDSKDYFKINSTIHSNYTDVSGNDKPRCQLLAYGMDILYMLASITLITDDGGLLVEKGIKIDDLINSINKKIHDNRTYYSSVFDLLIKQFSIACILLQLSGTVKYFNSLKYKIKLSNYDETTHLLSILIDNIEFKLDAYNNEIKDEINIRVKVEKCSFNDCIFIHPT